MEKELRKLKTIGVACAVIGLAMSAAAVRADEIDEMLKTDQTAVMVDPAAVVKLAEAVPAERGRDGELQRALNEIVRLKRQLAEQETRYQLELQRSYYNMGCVYKAVKQYDRAESEFLRALAANPKDAAVHYNLGILYDDDLHQPAKARLHFDIFLALAPGDRDAPQVQEWLDALSK